MSIQKKSILVPRIVNVHARTFVVGKECNRKYGVVDQYSGQKTSFIGVNYSTLVYEIPASNMIGEYM